ncbi:hydrolase [Pseudoalteromonas phenolica O-BC30]|uniref:Altronate hydrolase n=2 Tax=Pseudoalteromonas phenolica TaxID=161398 RepID=A0A0S2K470_9GAMM|nr:Altronate hydrolase [Pseudoalteromonas phenolica]MBE0355997.1 altronate dehydratase large subunit [Pseudoalteromonas phenolica O-BC30]RXE94705.1 hydrolase [Pseudoalteromonas phenolica O-BC30]
MKGYLRNNGKKGIRNATLVVYLVECAKHVASKIVDSFDNDSVQLVGFSGCYPNDYALDIMTKLCTHPNVGSTLIVSLGCEGFNREALANAVKDSGRPCSTLVIQQNQGTAKSIVKGKEIVAEQLNSLASTPLVDLEISDIVVGTICGGSDGTSGITANPAVGSCFDHLIDHGATCMFEETGELIGCEDVMIDRAANQVVAANILGAIEKAEIYYQKMGYGSFAPGNAEGGLTTQEEKSMGAYAKSGRSEIQGVIKPGEAPSGKGLYLMDVVPDGEPMFGFPNIADNAEIVEMIASGCHLVLFTTGRGSVVGSAISPIVKVCANPETYENLSDDMDVNAGKILLGESTINETGQEIVNKVIDVCSGKKSKSEQLGHQEFVLTYKRFNHEEDSKLTLKHKGDALC